ncbi:unnamed protein product [Sphagnum tenellum]
MSVLAAAVVRELGMMHLVTGNESYKTASGVVTRALGRVDEVQVKIGGIKCSMTFMVVDTDGLSEYGSARNELGTVLPQQHSPEHDSVIPAILQADQVVIDKPDHQPGKGTESHNHPKSEDRWKEICERIKVDPNLEEHGQEQLWATLERYKDVFA